jgi:hypothetical protein
MMLAKPQALLMFLQWPDADMLASAGEIKRMMVLLGQPIDPVALARSAVRLLCCGVMLL